MNKQVYAAAVIACMINSLVMAEVDTAKNAKKTEASKVATRSDSRTEIEIAFVDSLSLMRECEKGKDAARDLDKKRMEMAQDLQKEEQKLMQEANDYKAKAAMMSDAAREKEEKRLMKSKKDYESTLLEYEEDFKIAMQRVTEELSKDIDEAIVKVGIERGCDKVICSATGRVWNITNKGSITENVKTDLDKNYSLAKNKSKAPSTTALTQNSKNVETVAAA